MEQSIEEIAQVLETKDINKFKVLKNHSLTKINSPQNLDSRLLKRLTSHLQAMFRCDSSTIAGEIKAILPLLQGKPTLQLGYIGANLQGICEVLGKGN